MKQFKTSTGEVLPKLINWLANKEHERLGYWENGKKTDSLEDAFRFNDSNIFGNSFGNSDVWYSIFRNNFQPFYDQFPICKNSRGQILPDEIQIEIIEERLRQGLLKETTFMYGFRPIDSVKGNSYWRDIFDNSYYSNDSDYSTQSDEFTQGEIVEMSNYKEFAPCVKMEYVSFYKHIYVGYSKERKTIDFAKYCRTPITEYTIDQLIEKVSKAEGKPVKLKV